MILDEASTSIDTRTEAPHPEGDGPLMEGRTVFVIARLLRPQLQLHRGH